MFLEIENPTWQSDVGHCVIPDETLYKVTLLLSRMVMLKY
jgi:hypothetical protein